MVIKSKFDRMSVKRQVRDAGPIDPNWETYPDGTPRGDPNQNMPVVGRLFAHAIENYWASAPIEF